MTFVFSNIKKNNSHWGQKCLLWSEYDPNFVAAIKSLPWETSHRKWDASNHCWELDLAAAEELAKKLSQTDGLENAAIQLSAWLKTQTPAATPQPRSATITITNDAVLTPLPLIWDKIPNFSRWVRKNLGFPHPNEWEIRKYSKKDLSDWDGRIVPVQYERKDGKLHALHFGIADMPIIQEHLESHGLEVEIDDQRPLLPLATPSTFNLKLWDCQQAALTHILSQLQEKGNCMYQLPTGVGKTEVALAVIHQLRVKTIILVNRKDLMYQWQRRIHQRLGVAAGIVGDGKYELAEITVATVQSLWAYLKREGVKSAPQLDLIEKFIDRGEIEHDSAPIQPELFKNFSLVILDEVHVGAADTFLKVLLSFTAKYFLGQSATTWRSDKMHPLLWGVFGEPEWKMGINDAVKQHLIVPPRVHIIRGITCEAEKYPSAIKEIKESPERNQIIADIAKKAPKPCLILTKQVSHQKFIKRAVKAVGLSPFIVNGKSSMDVRKRTLQSIARGDNGAQVVIATPIWDEGVDAPGIASVIFAFPFKSDVKTYQRLGRGVRTTPGKNAVEIYDIADHQKHLSKQYTARRVVYEKEGWLVE